LVQEKERHKLVLRTREFIKENDGNQANTGKREHRQEPVMK